MASTPGGQALPTPTPAGPRAWRPSVLGWEAQTCWKQSNAVWAWWTRMGFVPRIPESLSWADEATECQGCRGQVWALAC